MLIIGSRLPPRFFHPVGCGMVANPSLNFRVSIFAFFAVNFRASDLCAERLEALPHIDAGLRCAMQTLPSDNLDFAWDRPETESSLQAKLAAATPAEWIRLAAWIMREARVEEVWRFLTLPQIDRSFPELAPLLDQRRPLWEYLLKTARELGKL